MRTLACIAILMMTAHAMAQNQNQGAPSFNGIVVGADAQNHRFSVVDKNGAVAWLAVTGNTSFQQNKTDVNASEVIRFGMEVRGTFAADGSVEQVTARGITSQLNVAQMRAFLGVNDEEWAVLKPKIEKIQALRKIAESKATSAGQNGNSGNGNGNGNNPPPPKNPVMDLQRNLNAMFFNQASSAGQLQASLETLRNRQASARDELSLARKNLTDLITTRQEVLLVLMGVLE